MNKLMRNYLIFCHFAVPVVFFAAVCNADNLTWQSIVVLVIASSPFILPLLAYYVKGFGKDGVMMNNVFDGSVAAPKKAAVEAAAIAPEPAQSPEGDAKTLGVYSKPARKILRTLRKYQAKETPGQLWAFGVHPLALDYPQFQAGVSELRFDGLIQNDGRGMVYLTEKGIKFCSDNKSAFDGGGDTWDQFGPV